MNLIIDQTMKTIYVLSTVITAISVPLLFFMQLRAETKEESNRTKMLLLRTFTGYTVVWLAYRLIK